MLDVRYSKGPKRGIVLYSERMQRRKGQLAVRSSMHSHKYIHVSLYTLLYLRHPACKLLEHHVESIPTRTQEGDVSTHLRLHDLCMLILTLVLYSSWTRSCSYIFMVAERSAALCVVLIFSLTSLSTMLWKRLLPHKNIILEPLYVPIAMSTLSPCSLDIISIGYSREQCDIHGDSRGYKIDTIASGTQLQILLNQDLDSPRLDDR